MIYPSSVVRFHRAVLRVPRVRTGDACREREWGTTVSHQYDAAHRVTKWMDAKGQETRYTYDGYGRLAQVQHWAPQMQITGQYILTEQEAQRVTYSYDSNPLNGGYSQNAWGRLTAVQFRDGGRGTPFSYMYSYNQAGRVTAQHMDYDGGRLGYDATYSWDNEGRMTGINYGPQYGFTYDANGRLGGMQDVESGQGIRRWRAANYGVAGEMLGMSYFGYNETRTYNSLLQMTHVTVPGMMDMQYLYTAGANNGRIAQSVDGVTGETLTYGYDRLNRLSGVSGTWSQTYSYDGFGNLTGKSAVGAYPAMNASFDPLTNRQNGLSYDANGNVTANGAGYDVENRLVGDSTALYVYDHAGKRVQKRYQATEEYYFYGISGQKLVTQVCQTTESGWGCGDRQYNVYFGGKLVKSKGVVVVTERLGSVRANSNGERMSYYPYGEEKTSTADGREKFGTYTRDSATQDYADQRYYAVGMGRFNSADPSSGSSADEPGSWNKYAHVQGDPVNFADPSGLNRLMCDTYDDEGRCAGQGGGGGVHAYTNFVFFPSEGGGYVPQSTVFVGSPSGGGDPQGGGGGRLGTGATGGNLMMPSISDSRARVLTLLQKLPCALAIGATSPESATERAESISISYGRMTLPGFSDLPYLTADANGSISPNQLAGQYLNGNITLNSAVNWANPSGQPAIDPTGNVVTTSLGIPGVAAAVPTAQQFIDFYVLHELAHSFGAVHDEQQLGTTTSFYNEAIWNSCFH